MFEFMQATAQGRPALLTKSGDMIGCVQTLFRTALAEVSSSSLRQPSWRVAVSNGPALLARLLQNLHVPRTVSSSTSAALCSETQLLLIQT